MPDRYLREALLNSERWNALSLDARDCYMRLLLIVDDHGCYDGRPAIIAAQAYRYGRTEALPLAELQRAELIVRYTNAGKPYIAVTQWGEVRRGPRKFPAPPVNVDRPELRYIGVFGRAPVWKNPLRCDAVSVLLDVNGRAVQPQPPEWRRSSDWSPLDWSPEPDDHGDQALRTTGTPRPEHPSLGTPSLGTPRPIPHRNRPPRVGPDAPSPEVPRSGPLSLHQYSPSSNSPVEVVVESTTPLVSPESPSPEHPRPTPPPPPKNGEIKINDKGEWAGVDEPQRLRWQDMFADLSIPDELDHAGQWLIANPKERAVYERQDDGLRAYLIRWLLKSSRERTAPARASPDSQGKR